MSARNDLDLEMSLRQALPIIACEPPVEDEERIRLAVASQHRPKRRLALKPLPVVGGVVLALGTTAGAVAAAGVPLPSPLRTVAVAIGLPVDDAQVAAAKGEIAALEGALASGNSEAIALDVAGLRSNLQAMSPEDREKVALAAGQALRQVDEFESSHKPGEAASTGQGGSSSQIPENAAIPPAAPSSPELAPDPPSPQPEGAIGVEPEGPGDVDGGGGTQPTSDGDGGGQELGTSSDGDTQGTSGSVSGTSDGGSISGTDGGSTSTTPSEGGDGGSTSGTNEGSTSTTSSEGGDGGSTSGTDGGSTSGSTSSPSLSDGLDDGSDSSAQSLT